MWESWPPELQTFVQEKIAMGEFQTPQEFVIRAATLYRDLDQRYERLRHDLQLGVEQLQAGSAVSVENDRELAEFFADVRSSGQQRLEELSRE